MTIVLLALGILCGLACVVLATAASDHRFGVVAMSVCFVVTALWIGQRPPDPAWAGLLVVAMAALGLARPRQRTLLAAGAGVFAALWASFLHEQGAPLIVSWSIAAALLGITVVASRRPDFAGHSIREEALLLICCFGLLVALAPELVAGWHSATTLNAASVQSRAIEGWVLLVGAASIVAGSLSALARKR
jgi:hypothetical protein